MSKFVGIAKIEIKDLLAYRFSFAIWLLSIPIMLAIYYFLWKAIFAYTGEEVIRGFTFSAMISYYVLTQVVRSSTVTWIAPMFSEEVRYGELVPHLLKPINYFFFRLSALVGDRIFLFFAEALPVFIIGLIFFGLHINQFFPFFIISVILAFLLKFIMDFSIGMSAFWFKENEGFLRAWWIIDRVIDGSLLPLVFFPGALQAISMYLPFQYCMYVPVSIFLGKYSFALVYKMLLIQVFWILVIFLILNLLWKKGIKRFTGVGA